MDGFGWQEMVIFVVVAVLVIVPLWLMVRETRSRHGDAEYKRGLELPPAAAPLPEAEGEERRPPQRRHHPTDEER